MAEAEGLQDMVLHLQVALLLVERDMAIPLLAVPHPREVDMALPQVTAKVLPLHRQGDDLGREGSPRGLLKAHLKELIPSSGTGSHPLTRIDQVRSQLQSCNKHLLTEIGVLLIWTRLSC